MGEADYAMIGSAVGCVSGHAQFPSTEEMFIVRPPD
jgi:hypothetical protein